MTSEVSLAQKFNQAVAQHRAGHMPQAERGYRDILAANPRHAGALHLLGVAMLHAGKPEAAIDLISKSTAVDANDVNAYLNLGNAYQAASRIADAIAAYRQAIRLQPAFAAAHSALSNALAKTNAFDDAATAARTAIDLSPQAVEGHKNLGIALHKAGALPAALDAYRAALSLDASDAELNNNLGQVLFMLGDYAAAITQLTIATKQSPQFGPAWFSLGNALKQEGKVPQAIEALLRANELLPEAVEPLIDLAAAWQLAGNFEQALLWLTKAVAKNPQSALVHNNLGLVLQRLGRIEDAATAYAKATQLDPAFSDAWGNLALFYEQSNQLEAVQTLLNNGLALFPEDPLLNLVSAKFERRNGQLRKAVERLHGIRAAHPQNKQNDKICAELGRLYDSLDAADEAFTSFERANALVRNKPAARFFANSTYLQSIEILRTQVTSEWYDAWQNVDATDGQAPVFLIGFPRSGTTLQEQILASHPLINTLDEQALVNSLVKKIAHMPKGYPAQLIDFTPTEIDALRNDYWQLAQRASPLSTEQILIDKFPLNILHVPLIQRLFPNAKLILALRHPADVCLSCFMQEFELNEAMVNFLRLEDTVALYDAVMRLWQHYVQVLPLNYCAVKYEDVVIDMQSEAQKILQFIGVDWDSAVLRYTDNARQRGRINTPSYHQVTQPIYQHATYRWQRYAEQLQPFLATLQPHCERFGYTQEKLPEKHPQ